MPSHNVNSPRGAAWGSGTRPPDIKGLVRQEKEKLINEARRDYNKVIPLVEGEKDQRIREADGYRLKRINEAEGDVARFSALLTEYTKSPEVTRRRIYIETLQEVLPGIRSKIIIDEQTRGILPLLNLDLQTGDRL